jgi:hypothetical protein
MTECQHRAGGVITNPFLPRLMDKPFLRITTVVVKPLMQSSIYFISLKHSQDMILNASVSAIYAQYWCFLRLRTPKVSDLYFGSDVSHSISSKAIPHNITDYS